jgi:hypothetical protein
MKVGDLVKLSDRQAGHPAYKEGALYLVSKIHPLRLGPKTKWARKQTVEIYTPDGKLCSFDIADLEVVSESR